MTNPKKIIIFLGCLLLICLIINDFILTKERKYFKADEFSFATIRSRDIFEKLLKERITVEHSREAAKTIIAYAHIIECNHYLLYDKKISLKTFYDSVLISLYPPQRQRLRDKHTYAGQARKFLRKNRRIDINSLKYELSKPEFYGEKDENAKIYVIRTTSKGKYYINYSFKKYGQWYYLYLTKPKTNLRFRLLNLSEPKANPRKNLEKT